MAQFGLPYNTGNTGPGQQINKGNDMSRSPITVPTPAMPQQQRGRPAGVGPMRARPQERKIDTSPYGSTVYLR